MNPYDTLTQFLFGKEFGADTRTVDQYRRGVELIPEGLVQDDLDLRFLSLADPRPGLLRACRLLGVQFEELGYTKDSAEPFDDRFPVPTAPFWFRHDDGRRNNDRRPDHCRDELTGDIQAGTAMEGIFAYAHHPRLVVEGEHNIDLPRTVLRDVRAFCAYLEVWDGQAKLFLCRHSALAFPRYGALRLRRK